MKGKENQVPKGAAAAEGGYDQGLHRVHTGSFIEPQPFHSFQLLAGVPWRK
jgi:hypothetical protein